MNFVFEDGDCNFVDCQDTNTSGIRRFTSSPIVTTMLRYKQVKKLFKNINWDTVNQSHNPEEFSKYIISAGVTHAPGDWVGQDSLDTGGRQRMYYDRKCLFEHLTPTYLEHMRQGRAFLLLDQSHEGYHTEWLFDWFHHNCAEYGINPKQIIYVTGDLAVTDKYMRWLEGREVPGRMCTVGHPHFEASVNTHKQNITRILKQPPVPTVQEQLAYKTQNLANIKLYNALQKRPRAHRAWLFMELVKNDLLHDGINSMNSIPFKSTYYCNRFMDQADYDQMATFMPMLPPHTDASDQELRDFANMDSGKYQMRLNDDLMLDSWFSIISEASFGENQCFISEKTFKPLVVGHPFIVYGNRYSMEYLKEMGYKTFHPWIDETYDKLDTWQRLDAIILAIKKVKALTPEQKLEWFQGMTDILEHNIEMMARNGDEYLPDSYLKIKRHFEAN